jgi:dienelactone hydrolase
MSKHFKVILFMIYFIAASLRGQEFERYKDKVFSNVFITKDIKYGESISVMGRKDELLLDLYQPSNDTSQFRPVIIFIHGGGFQNGDKASGLCNRVGTSMAKRGYVVASINYRLSSPEILTDSLKYFEALYRGVQDAKASIRFFRKYYEKYKIDSNLVFVMGSSAGAKISLHTAYLNQYEVPSDIDTSKLGTIEGESGNPGYSSIPNGVVNCWGALWNLKWLQKGDVPVYSVHGTKDKLVPADSSFSYNGFKYGSILIQKRADDLKIVNGLRLFEGAGHTLDNDTTKQDIAIESVSDWLYFFYKESEDIVNPSSNFGTKTGR